MRLTSYNPPWGTLTSMAAPNRGRPDALSRGWALTAWETGDPARASRWCLGHILRRSAAKVRRDAGESVEDVRRFLDHSRLAAATTYLRPGSKLTAGCQKNRESSCHKSDQAPTMLARVGGTLDISTAFWARWAATLSL